MKTRYKELKKLVGGAEILTVTKYFDEAETLKIIHTGISLIGESKIQLAKKKYHYFQERDMQVSMHMIGHLQTNKIKDAIEIFDCIQSVDRFKLLNKINTAVLASNHIQTQEIYLQVNATGEEQKYGFTEVEIRRAFEICLESPGVECTGVMCMGKLNDPEKTQAAFRLCRSLCDEFGLQNCSMGMSLDREIAVAEGATMLRLGGILFG